MVTVYLGKRCVSVRNLRHFPSGVAWDPKGKYIVTMSTDRKMDLIDATKGTRLRAFGVCALPAVTIGEIQLEHKVSESINLQFQAVNRPSIVTIELRCTNSSMMIS